MLINNFLFSFSVCALKYSKMFEFPILQAPKLRALYGTPNPGSWLSSEELVCQVRERADSYA